MQLGWWCWYRGSEMPSALSYLVLYRHLQNTRSCRILVHATRALLSILAGKWRKQNTPLASGRPFLGKWRYGDDCQTISSLNLLLLVPVSIIDAAVPVALAVFSSWCCCSTLYFRKVGPFLWKTKALTLNPSQWEVGLCHFALDPPGLPAEAGAAFDLWEQQSGPVPSARGKVLCQLVHPLQRCPGACSGEPAHSQEQNLFSASNNIFHTVKFLHCKNESEIMWFFNIWLHCPLAGMVSVGCFLKQSGRKSP